MKRLKSLLPEFVRAPIIRLIERYHRSTYYRNQIFDLGGRLNGYQAKGGKIAGFDNGTYENDLCTIIDNNVRSGMVCVDVGAHIGYITLLFAKLTGAEGQVTAFEAHPQNAYYVDANIQMNQLTDYVRVENIAVSDGQSSSVNLGQGRMSRAAEWKIQRNNAETTTQITVPATSLDQYFATGSRIDFVKMDIEGAEEQALPGMKRILQESRPVMCIEFHHDNAWAARQVLLDAGYKLYNIQKHEWVDESTNSRSYHCLAVPDEKIGTFNYNA